SETMIDPKSVAVADTIGIAVADTMAGAASDTVVSTVDPSARGRITVLPPPKGAAPAAADAKNRHRYEHQQLLGEGGIGEVHRARDNDIERLVAVKRLRPRGARDAASLARFVDEIRMVGQLEHPNIVPIHDVGVDASGEYYFVMKYVEGETLEAVIQRLD